MTYILCRIKNGTLEKLASSEDVKRLEDIQLHYEMEEAIVTDYQAESLGAEDRDTYPEDISFSELLELEKSFPECYDMDLTSEEIWGRSDQDITARTKTTYIIIPKKNIYGKKGSYTVDYSFLKRQTNESHLSFVTYLTQK